MIPSLDPSTLSAPAQKIASPAAPEKLQLMAARGIAPGIKPAEALTLVVLFTSSDRAAVKEAANKTLASPPAPLLNGALSGDLPPQVIDALARAQPERMDVLEKLLAMPAIASETVTELARTGSEALTELIATNEDRLLKHPAIIEKLYMNKRARMSTADRLVELAVRNGLTLDGIGAFRELSSVIQDELIVEPTPEPTPDDLLFQETDALSTALSSDADEDTHEQTDEGDEVLKDKFKPLYQRIAEMTVSQKIRRALLGSKEERMLLVRDANRVVASSTVRSPLMQENEVVLISRNRNVDEEVLRVIGQTPEWTKSYAVKRNLVENPKTPVMLSTRLIPHLRENDLRNLAKSKNVTGPVKDAARRHLERRKS